MSRYGDGICTECGHVSALLLAPRFPHICSRCLFPQLYADSLGLPRVLMTEVQRVKRARKATALDTA